MAWSGVGWCNLAGKRTLFFPKLFRTYPALRDCGGMQLLLSKEKPRTELRIVSHGACTVEELRCFGSGRVYIRPLQRNIPFIEQLEVEDEHEDCLSCLRSIPISEMQEHLEICSVHNSRTLSSGDEKEPTEIDSYILTHSSSITSVITIADDDNITDRQLPETGSEEVDRDQGTAVAFGISEAENLAPNGVDSIDNIARKLPYNEHLRKAIDCTISEMTDCHDPTTILRTFRRHLLRGRPLDPEDESSLCEGETTEIFISRVNLYEDTMDELIPGASDRDFSLPLEVTFTGECADDYGGPRREFLGIVIREIRERLFTEGSNGEDGYKLTQDVTAKYNNYYFAAGLLFGFSIIQGGPLPCFMNENLIQKLLGIGTGNDLNNLTKAEQQFQHGLANFGIVELCSKKQCMLYLFRKTAFSEITYPKLMKLLTPTFSPDGNNRRLQEERAYRLFLNYVKEVAANRRGSLSVGNVLKFITGASNEPVLGYAMKPTITFDEHMPSCLPTSNTCINRLTLAIGKIIPEDKERVYGYFDFAFHNNYFGRV